MRLWSWLDSGGGSSSGDDDAHTRVNPATGLPMTGAIDVDGNPFGLDLHRSSAVHDSSWSHCSALDWTSPGMDAAGGFDHDACAAHYNPTRGW